MDSVRTSSVMVSFPHDICLSFHEHNVIKCVYCDARFTGMFPFWHACLFIILFYCVPDSRIRGLWKCVCLPASQCVFVSRMRKYDHIMPRIFRFQPRLVWLCQRKVTGLVFHVFPSLLFGSTSQWGSLLCQPFLLLCFAAQICTNLTCVMEAGGSVRGLDLSQISSPHFVGRQHFVVC